MDANSQQQKSNQVLNPFSRKADAYRSLPIRFTYENVEAIKQELKPDCAGNLNCEDLGNNTNALKEFDCNINDCLQDLDKYLEEIDTSSVILKNDDDQQQQQQQQHHQQQQQQLNINNNNNNVQLSPINSMNTTTNTNSSHYNSSLSITSGNDRSNRKSMQRSHQFRKTMDNHQTRRRSNNSAYHESSFENPLWRCKSARELSLNSQDASSSPSPSPSSSSSLSHVNPTAATPRTNEILTQEQIFSNILNECNHSSETRPRQFGRRATGQPTIMALRATEHIENRRPASAPTTNHISYERTRERDLNIEITASSLLDSEASSYRSSHIPSPYSSVSTSDSSSSSFSANQHQHQHHHHHHHHPHSNSNSHRDHRHRHNHNQNEIITSPSIHQEQASDATTTTTTTTTTTLQREQSDFYNTDPLGGLASQSSLSMTDCNSEWPHMLSQLFALISCTLGLCNLCRFCVLVINYGGSFLLQFFVLSILFGIPLFWLLMCLGSRIKSGCVAMWKISPISKGIGIALLLLQFVIAIYSSVSIAWIFVYIRDSFPKSYKYSMKMYRLQENGHSTQYIVQNLTKDVSDYFHIDVLQRLDGERSGFKVSDQLALYLSVVWALVFIVLSRGLRSLGKFTYLFTTLPIAIFIVITVKMVFFLDSTILRNLFSTLDINDFAATQSWIAAAQETFLTWGLMGPSVITMTSRVHASANKFTLRKNALIVVLTTFLVLFMAMILGLCSINILRKASLFYVPGSYDNPEKYTSIYSKTSLNPELLSFPPMLVPHYSSFMGEIYRRPFAAAHNESGYQALRFISEIFPAIVALSNSTFTWVWVFLTLAMFLLFGLAQLCVMWKPISSILGNSTSSVLLSCVTGLMLSIPFATEMGIRIIHYTDLLFGASWIVPILWMLLIFGVFLIRGRPYNGDDLVNDLKMSTSISAFLALAWNIMLPIGLPLLSIVSYKASNSKQFYHMNGRTSLSHWARKLAGSVQISILLLVPIVAIIQIFRYLSKGPSDIFERIQLLYRPPPENSTDFPSNQQNMNRNHSNNGQNPSSRDSFPNLQTEDSPPKYTPPPSYTTATGARIAKFIRQSIRRSVRRIRSASNYARPSSFEPEAEMIVTDLSSTMQHPIIATDFPAQTAEHNIDDACCMESDNGHDAGFFRQRQKNNHRVSSLPRIMQHSALINDIVIRPSSLACRIQPDNATEFRSIENLTQNAEPPAQSQPPASCGGGRGGGGVGG